MKRLKKILLNPKLIISVVSIILALIVGCVIILITGNNPFVAYGYMIEGSFGSTYRITEVIVQGIPLIFTGLAITFAYNSGVFSIGADGQLLMGSILSIWIINSFSHINGVLLIVIALVCGIIGGGVWGMIAGALKSYRGISEIISTMMLNYIALNLASYFYSGPLKSSEGMQPRTEQVVEQARLPILIEGTRLHLGIIIALIMVVAVSYLLYHTSIGKRFRAVGLNREAAVCLGIPVKRYMMLSLAISGALAGMGGVVELLSVQNRVQSGFCADYGFDGIAVALMGQLTPGGVVIAAFFFSFLKVGANYMEVMTTIPSSAITLIQGVIIIFIASGSAIIQYKKKSNSFKGLAKRIRRNNPLIGGKKKGAVEND